MWLAAAASALFMSPLPGKLMLTVGTGLLLVEILKLRRRVEGAIARTTRGAGDRDPDRGPSPADGTLVGPTPVGPERVALALGRVWSRRPENAE